MPTYYFKIEESRLYDCTTWAASEDQARKRCEKFHNWDVTDIETISVELDDVEEDEED